MKRHSIPAIYIASAVLWPVILGLAVFWIGLAPSACAEGNHESLPADLHDAVTRAEEIADRGEFGKAAESLSKYLKTYQGKAYSYPHYDLGWFRYKAKQLKSAVPPLRMAVKIKPDFIEAWQLLAAVHHESGRPGSAAEAMERAAALTHKAELKYQAAVFRLKAGQEQKAAKLLAPLLKDKNAPADWFIAMADIRRTLKQPDRAASAMAAAAKRSGQADHQYQAALLWLEAQKPKMALPLLQSLAKRKNPRSEWLVALSNTLQKMKKKVETARAMEKAARISKKPDLLYQAAWLWLDIGRPQNALPLLEMLVQRKKVKTDWLLALCDIYMKLERIPEAAAVMDRVIAQDPKPEYLYNGGALWVQADKPKRALPHLLKLAAMAKPRADWLVALAHAHIKLNDIPNAAAAMERAAGISKKPEHAYQAGVLRLQLKQADQALKLLGPLEKHPDPKAEWLAALSNAWVLKEKYARAAPPMERAAKISGKPAHYYRAAQLWLQAENPRKALPLLQWLARQPKPQGAWLVTLSNTHQMLNDIPAAAAAMERAAGITKKGAHYYRAGMLWREADNMDKTVEMLRASLRHKPVRQRWIIDLASVLMTLEKNEEAVSVMARSDLTSPRLPSTLRYRGAVIWLNLLRPKPALPILAQLCRQKNPRYEWMVSWVKTSVETGDTAGAENALKRFLNVFRGKPEAWELAVWVALQRNDYTAAAAALEVAAELDPAGRKRLEELSGLYRMAGVPVKAVDAYRRSLKGTLSPGDWDRITGIYLGGGRYDLALEPARKAAEAGPTAERWESLGDIAYYLHRFPEAGKAYGSAAALSEDPGVRLKAGYTFMKLDDLDQAAASFKAALARAEAGGNAAREANQNLVYIEKLEDYRKIQAER